MHQDFCALLSNIHTGPNKMATSSRKKLTKKVMKSTVEAVNSNSDNEGDDEVLGKLRSNLMFQLRPLEEERLDRLM